MAETVFGEIDWNSGDSDGSGDGKIEWLKVKEGKTVVRVMGNPHQYYTHWLEVPSGAKKKINSPVGNPALLKKIEDAGFKRKPRWIVKVLDRTDDKFKLLDIGSQIYSGIKVLFNNPKWGNPSGYDITIERGSPGAQPLYRVTPDPKESLDPQLKSAFVEFNDRLDLSKFTEPTDASEIIEFMGWSTQAAAAQQKGQQKPKQQQQSDDDEEYFNFKS